MDKLYLDAEIVDGASLWRDAWLAESEADAVTTLFALLAFG